MKRTLAMRIIGLCCLGFILLNTSIVYTQGTDSTKDEVYSTVTDPAQNRLFWMSTGRTMPEGRVSLASFELFLLQFGYAPSEYFQMNLSYLLPFFGVYYGSVGTKIQIISPKGYFQGLSVGCDLGFYNVFAMNAAGSFGTEYLKAHLSIMRLTFFQSGDNNNTTWFSAGIDYILIKGENNDGAKIILETFMPQHERGYQIHTILLGIRAYTSNSAFDLTLPFSRSEFFYDEYFDNRFHAWKFPYFSYMFFL